MGPIECVVAPYEGRYFLIFPEGFSGSRGLNLLGISRGLTK
jgi:hypothetical protein